VINACRAKAWVFCEREEGNVHSPPDIPAGRLILRKIRERTGGNEDG